MSRIITPIKARIEAAIFEGKAEFERKAQESLNKESERQRREQEAKDRIYKDLVNECAKLIENTDFLPSLIKVAASRGNNSILITPVSISKYTLYFNEKYKLDILANIINSITDLKAQYVVHPNDYGMSEEILITWS